MVPSGKVDKETDPYGAAQRELQEETGFKSKDLSPYFTSKYSERLQYTAHVYLAKDLIAEPLPQDDTELIEVHELPLTEALEKVLKSDCTHTMSAFALLHYKHDLENGMWKTW
jgi:ADP-ribose pyrophosphatase